MKRKAMCVLAVLILFSGVILSSTNDLLNQKQDRNRVFNNSRFQFRLFNELYRNGNDGNICISPIGILTSLAVCYNGAAGSTAEAMAAMLGWDSVSVSKLNRELLKMADSIKILGNDGDSFMQANSLWRDHRVTLSKSFQDCFHKFFEGEIHDVNLKNPAASRQINDWIQKKMGPGNMPLLKNYSPEDILLILNACRFRGTWKVGFHIDSTREGPFYRKNGDSISLPMMVSQSPEYSYFQGEGFQAVRLPYASERIDLMLLLPDEDSSLENLLESIHMYESWLPRFSREMIRVTFPRLRIGYETELKDALGRLGMEDAFSRKADFSKMFAGSVPISEFRHHACIEFNEKGTQAGALTIVKWKGGGVRSIDFNRPFLWLIRDNETNVLLFAGSVVDLVLDNRGF